MPQTMNDGLVLAKIADKANPAIKAPKNGKAKIPPLRPALAASKAKAGPAKNAVQKTSHRIGRFCMNGGIQLN